MLHLPHMENLETEKEGFDLGEEVSNKTESKDTFGTFERKANETSNLSAVQTDKNSTHKEKIKANKTIVEK